MEPQPRVVVSASWRENSISALSRAALARGQLRERYVVDDRFVAHLALLKGGFTAPARAHARRARHRSTSRAMGGDHTVGRGPELLRILGAVGGSRLPVDVGNDLWKAAFDQRVARRVRRLAVEHPFRPTDVVIGMPGSSAATFAASGKATLVLDAIDSHPREHNHLLAQAYPDGRARDETYPEGLVRRIERELELADLVLVPSRLAAEGMRRHGVPASKLGLFPYAVALDTFVPAAAPVTPRARPSLLCVAQVSYRKGIPMLLEAARRAPGVDVRVAGPVFAPAVTAGAPANVRFLGTLDQAELAREYAAADAFVLPSLDDCFGLVVTEAAAAGLPLLVTATTGAVEVVADLPQTTVLDAFDVAGTAELLAATPRLDAETRLAHAAAFRSLDQTFLSWDRYADAVLDSADALTRGLRAA